MSMLNPFKNDAFNLIAMTEAINRIPNFYDRTGQLNLFRPISLTKTTFGMDELLEELNLLDIVPRGAPAPKNRVGKRSYRTFSTQHVPLEDVVLADEVQGVRALGSENSDETIAAVIARKMYVMRRKFDQTREYFRMGALKGILADASTNTIYNYYTEFGVTPEVHDFDLDDSATDVNAKCREVLRHIDDNLEGEMASGVHCFVSPEFYDALVAHASVKEAFKYFLTTQQLSGDYRGRFAFGGIVFEEYRGNSKDSAGTARKFVDANYGYAFPLGTSSFAEIFAPADFNETVNTPGLPYYAKQEPMPMNRGTNIHAQMNVLPICLRPRVIVKVGMNID